MSYSIPTADPLATWAPIAFFRQQTRVRAGSLIMSLFGDVVVPRGGPIWLGSVIRLLAPLGLSERLVRTSVFRLVQEGWLAADTLGRRSEYRLTPAGQRRFDEASRHIYAPRAPGWDEQWRLMLVVGELDGRSREKLRRALFWQGFGVLGADCFVHPGADLKAALEGLQADGLAELSGRLLPLLAREPALVPGGDNRDLVRRAWNLAALAGAYQDFCQLYQPVLAALDDAAASPETAFQLRLLLIHDYRRLLLRDPELPEVLLPLDWPGQAARRLCQSLYAKLGAASEAYLQQQFCLADGSLPPLAPSFSRRFAEGD